MKWKSDQPATGQQFPVTHEVRQLLRNYKYSEKKWQTRLDEIFWPAIYILTIIATACAFN